MKIKNNLRFLYQIVNYNLKIIFANKFFYFLLSAVGFFLMIAVINLWDVDYYPTESDVYYQLLFPGLLLVFYPSVFGIQNDMDTRMIELLFGIPNYRYKVWLVRLAIIYFMVFTMLLLLSLLGSVAIIPVSVFNMAFQLMFPVIFIGGLAFMLSTLIRNGNGTAAVMVMLGLAIWISSGILEESKWNVFLNPFDYSTSINYDIWVEMIFYNRLYLIIGTILTCLAGLYRLQKREKFM